MPTSNNQLEVFASRIQSSIARINPDLRDQTVLTEAASGAFMATAVAAAVAGAERVIAYTRDSCWGKACDITRETKDLAKIMGVSNSVEIRQLDQPLDISRDGIDIVTNLGFLRPISRRVIAQLPRNACISLMWEPWEFREEDIDTAACEEHRIPIIATNERHPNVSTFRAVGILVAKLLLECQFEVLNLRTLVVGSDPFGKACAELLQKMGSYVDVIDPTCGWNTEDVHKRVQQADAIVVIEHQHKEELFGHKNMHSLEIIGRRGLPFVHICGNIDDSCLRLNGIHKHPDAIAPVGYMSVTTGYVGIKPVIDLHVAGLHVGSLVARQRSCGASVESAIKCAIDSGYGLPLAR